jgi:hypothetical protein
VNAEPFGEEGVAEKRGSIHEKTCEQDRRRETIPAGKQGRAALRREKKST